MVKKLENLCDQFNEGLARFLLIKVIFLFKCQHAVSLATLVTTGSKRKILPTGGEHKFPIRPTIYDFSHKITEILIDY